MSNGPLSDSLLSGANVGVVVAMVFTLLAVSHWATESSETAGVAIRSP
ncbi:hypothetical protein NDI85_18140 [Halomicroarcula sp. S1AR25-4]|nr:hypothetical protein [Halomicroarcula sp. S1AR25-4]MDS0279718.1 hypothetical protein [Halomicroarcula sp. S1AR25-4]